MIRNLLFKKEIKRIEIVVITALFLLINIYLITRHEAWRDESQAWTIVKNLSLIDVFRTLPTEGHPCLWFLFIMPFAKLGLSFYCFSFVSLALMTITLYLFLKNAPFSLFVKIVVLFSSIFLYYNPVVSRIYSLIALIIISIACLYKERFDRPIMYGLLIAALFQTHVVAFGLGIGLTIGLIIDFVRERKNKKIFVSIALIFISFVLMVLEIMPRSSSPSGIDTSVSGMMSKFNPLYISDKLSNFAYTTWGIPQGILTIIAYVLLIIPVVLLFVFITRNKSWKKNYQIIIIAICGVGVFFGILIFIYTSHTQMSSILTMIILFVLWQLYAANNEENVRISCISLLLLLSFLSFIVPQSMMRQDVSGYFSDSKAMASVIEKSIPENGVILVENNVDDSPVYSYVVSKRKDITVYDIFNDAEYKFHKMGIEYREISVPEILAKAANFDTDVYYLTYSEKNDDNLQLIYSTNDFESIWNEDYYLYEVRR